MAAWTIKNGDHVPPVDVVSLALFGSFCCLLVLLVGGVGCQAALNRYHSPVYSRRPLHLTLLKRQACIQVKELPNHIPILKQRNHATQFSSL